MITSFPIECNKKLYVKIWEFAPLLRPKITWNKCHLHVLEYTLLLCVWNINIMIWGAYYYFVLVNLILNTSISIPLSSTSDVRSLTGFYSQNHQVRTYQNISGTLWTLCFNFHHRIYKYNHPLPTHKLKQIFACMVSATD